MMLHIPQVLSQEEAADIRRLLEQSLDWVDGRETVGVQGAQIKRNQQLADDCELKARLGQRITSALKQNPLFFAAALPLRIIPPRFNRYAGGETYGMHVDGSVMQYTDVNGQEQTLRSDLSCTVFFAEPEDYEGGELVVADTYGEHLVKLPAGDAILYPSSSLHEVRPVTKGARLASFLWIQSMVRSESQRRALFEMDTSITRLRETGADNAAVLQLTGVYHNLLRDWSDT